MALYNTEAQCTDAVSLHHRALYDCYITAALFIDITNTFGWTAEQIWLDIIDGLLHDDFHFGKYCGKAASTPPNAIRAIRAGLIPDSM